MKKSDIPDLYRIKYWLKGDKSKVYFGTVSRYGEEAQEHWKNRNLVVEDPIDGQLTLVPYDRVEIQKQEFGWSKCDPETNMSIETEFDRHINNAYKEAMRKSKEAGEGVAKNKLFTVSVADGYAYYVVTKVNKKSVKIEWRGFCPDRYADGTLGYGGTFPMHCIENHIHWQDARDKIFNKD